MPNTINYQSLSKTLSIPRIQSYKTLFIDHTDQEIYGIYLWNKALCGAIYPILQAAEIALRNSIDSVARELHGDYWYESIPHYQDTDADGNLVNNKNYKSLKDSLNNAKRSVNRTLRKTQNIPDGHKPSFDKVISETNFVVWEYVLHPCFFKVGDRNFLWPTKTRKAFSNWPHQSAKDTHTRLYDLVSEIRPFRNRLSHHEPLWKGTTVTTEIEAIEFISKKIKAIEELLHIICDEKVKYLNLQSLFRKAKGLSSKKALDRYRYRSKSQQLSLKHKRKVKQFLFEAHDNDLATIFEYGGRTFTIERA